MTPLKQLLSWSNNPYSLTDEKNRKYQLIFTITIELLILGLLLLSLNICLNFWFIACMLGIGIIIVLGNLILLKKNYSLVLCGHILNILCFAIITIGNIWLSGITTTSLGWFYISPIIAAVTIGLDGLIIYSVLSASVLLIFIFGNFNPSYILPAPYLSFLDNINHIFIFLLIFTTLYNLLIENKQYETLLKEQNFLLYTDKQKFHYLSHHDSLTNLPNRSYFHAHLQEVLDAANIAKNSVTLFFMDLDGFKKINDQYGHEIGDILLLQTSKRLQSCFRTNDFIARLGGDEFTAIIIHSPTDAIADTLVDRIKKEFKLPFYIKNLEIKCSISVGKASYPTDALDIETFLKVADDAMYKNKKRKQLMNKQST